MIKLKNWLPFSIEIRFNPDELIEAVADAAPIGKHEHDRELRYKKVGFPRAGGRLKNWFRNRANWHLRAPRMIIGGRAIDSTSRNKTWRMWTTTPKSIPYAAIQEFGGSVGPAAGKLMRWFQSAKSIGMTKHHAANNLLARRFRAGYQIAAQEYAKRGLTKFATQDLDVKVRWK